MSVFYFNRLPVVGPWGGGNKTLSSIAARLQAMSHTVVGEFSDDADVVFCVDPRPSSSGVTYQKIFDFASSRKLPIIQRVGDVGTHGKPDLTHLVKFSTSLSDRVIFTSKWARDYIGCSRESSIIPNGSLSDFYSARNAVRVGRARPRVVTHHWSNNPMKGIAYYERLQEEIDAGKHSFDFTYIGRSSASLEKRTIPPLDVQGLVKIMPDFDIYLSASLHEAGANHILEAMACGLPVVYSRNGGSIPEYCDGRGVEFSSYEEMVDSLMRVSDDYLTYQHQSLTYKRTMDDVVDEYVEILCGK